MDKPFADHFAALSRSYADARPHYPPALFAWLAEVAPATEVAWDCACGSAQASLGLAEHFARVVATDASAAQLAEAPQHPRVNYHQAPAEASGLAATSVDLVAVAQALHWFDLEGFYAEVRRVLRPDGVLAVWSYGPLRVAGGIVDGICERFCRRTVGPYWPPERALVEEGYRSLAFPFAELAAPHFAMCQRWTLTRLLGYFRSWSATGRYIAARGEDPVAGVADELAAAWGDPAVTREITWPLAVRAGRVVY